ncbi:hypothetical protein [Aquibium carbonis]|uniref:hypothetical protein n=1 Tax=Aquibium carbonis TaxID=2495581 RepID=UPI0014787326|nr:hypothetical protein [Aquibium carbonis]
MTKNIGWEPERPAAPANRPLKGFGRRIVDLSLPLLLVVAAYWLGSAFFDF